LALGSKDAVLGGRSCKWDGEAATPDVDLLDLLGLGGVAACNNLFRSRAWVNLVAMVLIALGGGEGKCIAPPLRHINHGQCNHVRTAPWAGITGGS
jgi:hypothetical protein